METLTVPLEYRTAEEADIPGLVRLWEENSGWGKLTPEIWRQWYFDTPYGPCPVVVAVDEQGEIAAQTVMTPTRVLAGGTVRRAARLSAPIIRKDFRQTSIRNPGHPVPNLYRASITTLTRAGYSLLYVQPEHSWLVFFSWMGGCSYASYPCVGSPLPAAASPLPEADGRLEARVAREIGPEYERLWEEAAQALPFGCAVVRSVEWLRFKYGGMRLIEVREREGGALAGYCAIRPSDGLIMDLLARSPGELGLVLSTILRQHRSAPGTFGLPDRLCAMETSLLKPVLDRLGFTPVRFTFAFVCASLDPGLPLERISPERWYVTPGD